MLSLSFILIGIVYVIAIIWTIRDDIQSRKQTQEKIDTAINDVNNATQHMDKFSVSANSISISGSSISAGNISASPSATWTSTWTAVPFNSNMKYRPYKITENKATDKSLEHYIGYVWGVRVFHSIYKDYAQGLWSGRWYSPRMTARCKMTTFDTAAYPRIGEAPHPHPCRCGINIYNLDIMMQYISALDGNITDISKTELISTMRAKQLITASNRMSACLALTRGWGRVIRHDDGYRVQKALVTDIFLHDTRLPEGWVKRGVTVHNERDTFLQRVKEVHSQKSELIKIPAIESGNSDERRS